jgi:hypothetical protein
MDDLGAPQISGTFAVSSAAPGTTIARVPAAALQPAQVAVRNPHATAVLYLKWAAAKQTNVVVSATDAGVILNPGEGFVWNPPPCGAFLVVISTVDQSPICVDANWRLLDEALL